VAGTALTEGVYTLVSAAAISGGSTVNATPVFTGNGMASGLGLTATVSISGSNVILIVAASSSSYTLTYSADPNGSISGTTPQVVPSGTSGGAVTAVPNAYYHFVNWTDSSTANPRTDNPVMADVTVMANFAINTVAYNTWAGTYAGSGLANGDHNHDGIPNGVAYFMNIIAPGFTASPALNGSNTITWTNGGNIPDSQYGTQFVVQISNDLAVWDDVLITDSNLTNATGAVTYTLTGTAPRFVRLMVTPNPN